MVPQDMAQRNAVVDLLRMVFAFIIVLHHLWIQADFRICGYLAVDFFFLVSGYMVIMSCRRNQENGKEIGTIRYCAHKFMSFLPYLIFAEVVAGIISGAVSFDKYDDFPRACEAVWDHLKNILCLSMLNFYRGDVTWYLSALMISTAILYPIIRRSKVVFPRFVAPVIGVVLVILILVETGRINAPSTIMYGFVKTGLVRGLGEMCLGIFAFELIGMTKRFSFNKENIVFGIIEIGCYLAVLICIFAINPGKVNREVFEFLMVVLLFVALTITLSNRSITYEWVQKWPWACNNSTVLATGSLLIYLNHTYLIEFWNQWGSGDGIGKDLFVIIFAILMSIACYHAAKYIRAGIINAAKSSVND